MLGGDLFCHIKMWVWLLVICSVSALDIESCVETLLKDPFSMPCAKFLISKGLSYVMIAGSFFLKFPQILKIVGAKSVEGISFTSFAVELCGFTMMSAYSMHMNQPFSTYGENLIIAVQCWMQVMLFFMYGSMNKKSMNQFVGFYFLFIILPWSIGGIPEMMWQYMPLLSMPINFVVKGSQIITNFKQKSTGQVSLITNSLSLAGTAVRVFTTLVELSDPALVINYTVGTLLNFTMVLQIFMYWHNTPKSKVNKKD